MIRKLFEDPTVDGACISHGGHADRDGTGARTSVNGLESPVDQVRQGSLSVVAIGLDDHAARSDGRRLQEHPMGLLKDGLEFGVLDEPILEDRKGTLLYWGIQ